MATGGAGSQANTTATCSICLEPFKGRSPKLLPCFHTFCCQCLVELVDKSTTGKTRQVGGKSKNDVIIQCPTCRKETQVPPGGPSEFQGNFYLPEEANGKPEDNLQPLICEMCDREQLASHQCKRCQFKLCYHCHKVHGTCQTTAKQSKVKRHGSADLQELLEKGKDQIREMEAVIGTFDENMTELNRQRKQVSDQITASFNNALKKLNSQADAEEDRIKTERASIQRKRDALNHILSQEKPTHTAINFFLLPDDEMSSLKGKTVTEDLNSSDFDSVFLFGDGCPSQGLATVSVPSTSEEFQSQRLKLNLLSQTVEQLAQKIHEKQDQTKQNEMETGRVTNSSLLQKISDLQAENVLTQKQISQLRSAVDAISKDHDSALKQNSKMSQDLSDTQAFWDSKLKSVADGQLELAKQLAEVKDESSQIKVQVEQCQALSAKGPEVAFSASLTATAWTKCMKVLKCKNVELNIGHAYSPRTGKFRAPVSGLYLLSASVLAAEKQAMAAVIAGAGSNVLLSCQSLAASQPNAAHAVWHFDRGEEAWLETYDEVDCSFSSDDRGTCFSGVLLRADL